MGAYQPGIGFRIVRCEGQSFVALDLACSWLRWQGKRISSSRVLMLLRQEGLNPKPVVIDGVNRMIKVIPELALTAKYRRDARMSESPDVVNCSTFVALLYAIIGVGGLPLRAAQLWRYCTEVPNTDAEEGDLVFSAGNPARAIYRRDPQESIGHVGIVVGRRGSEQGVAHAVEDENVTSLPLEEFVDSKGFRGVRRIVKDFTKLYTLTIPQTLTSGKSTENFFGSECVLTHLATVLPRLIAHHPEAPIVPKPPPSP